MSTTQSHESGGNNATILEKVSQGLSQLGLTSGTQASQENGEAAALSSSSAGTELQSQGGVDGAPAGSIAVPATSTTLTNKALLSEPTATPALASAPTSGTDQVITPWDVEGAVVDGKQVGIDYDKLIDKFGTKKIDAELLARFERSTGHRPHLLLRRGMFFSHR
jgi:hypothetical protein